MAYISNELMNEIQNRCDIVDVVSRYVTLEKRGENYFGLCPFHKDHNESMSVSPKKQIFKCFVCPKDSTPSGNVFTFLSKYLEISFYEAVAMLGRELGYDIQVNNKKIEKNSVDYEIYDLATKFYQSNLYSTSGISAVEYLKQRNIDMETIKKFKIGLSLSKSTLTNSLLNKEYDLNKLIDLGITNENKKDKFINRIMFPLFDPNGRVVAFSGRIYNIKDNSKYINSMESEIFKKGNMLYNYHIAKSSAKKTDYVIVMEGFMDVIRASTIGIDNCVATMGTAFTDEHMNLLKRITNNIVLCFDGDKPGEDATISSLDDLFKAGFNTKVVRLPENLNSDEYILKYGADSFKMRIDNSISSVEYKISLYKKDKRLNDGHDKSNYINESIMELVKINDDIVVEHNLKKLSLETDTDYNNIKNRYDNYKINYKFEEKQEENIVEKDKLSQYEIAEYNLIYYMLDNIDVIKKVENNVIYFSDDLIRHLYNEIESFYNKYGTISTSLFISYLSDKQELLDKLNAIISYVEKEEYTLEEIDDYISVINGYLKKKKINSLKKELMDEIDPIKKAEILKKIMEVKGVKAW